MKFPIGTLAVLASFMLAGTALPALAAQVHLSATLLATTEVPPNDSPATGSLSADYDSETNVLNYEATYEGLTGAATAAHFHGPASPEETAPPVIPVEDLESPISGTVTLTDAQESDLLSGLWYFNIHTAKYPQGELRGQLLQSVMSSETSMMSSQDSSMMSSEMSSMSSVEVSASVDPSLSSASSGLSSAVSSVSSNVSSTVSSALDTSVDVSVSGSISASVAQ